MNVVNDCRSGENGHKTGHRGQFGHISLWVGLIRELKYPGVQFKSIKTILNISITTLIALSGLLKRGGLIAKRTQIFHSG